MEAAWKPQKLQAESAASSSRLQQQCRTFISISIASDGTVMGSQLDSVNHMTLASQLLLSEGDVSWPIATKSSTDSARKQPKQMPMEALRR